MVFQLEKLEQDCVAGACSTFRFCTAVAELFKVRAHEVAVLLLRHSMLHFVYPPELRSAGMIPLISSAQAAKTASTKRSEIFNNFIRVRHSSIFETVKVGGDRDPLTIQKLISVAIIGPAQEVVGVMQVSRKGATADEAGADFSPEDLRNLERVAHIFGRHWKRLQERSVDTAPRAAGA